MTTLNLEVDFSEDDAYEQFDTTVRSEVSPSLNTDATNEWLGFRFRSVTIAPGSTISTAVPSFVPSGTGNDEPNHTFYAEDVDNAAAFANTNANISGRTKTTANVTWSSTDLSATGSSRHNGPDMAALVQEVIDRGGWASGNALVLFCHGSADGSRDLGLIMFEGSAANAAHLDIDYTAAAASTTPFRMMMGVGT